MKTYFKTQNWIKNLFTVSFWFLFFIISPIFAQSVENQEVLKSIAKYTSGMADKTHQLLSKYGYNPPDYLRKEWLQYPAVRKIEMAFEAAETAQKGSK